MKQVFFGATASGSPNNAAWHAWRLAGIGGSDAGIIAAGAGLIAPASWMKPVEWLWQVKTGRRSAEIFVNAAMRRGTENEEPARVRYEKTTGILVSPAFGEMDENPFIRSSFDGIDLGQVLTVEIKVPNDEVHAAAKRGVVVEYYHPQLAHQALTLWGHPDNWNGKSQHFVSYHPETDDIAVVERIKTGDGYEMPLLDFLKPLGEKLLLEEITFWKNVMEKSLPCGNDWMLAASNYLRADALVEDAQASLELARSELIDLLGEKDKMAGAGVSITKTTKKGSVDYAGLIKELGISPDVVEQHRKKSSSSIVVRKLTGGEKDF